MTHLRGLLVQQMSRGEKQTDYDSKNTAPAVSQKQQAPHGQLGMSSRSAYVDSGSSPALIQDDEYDGLTPYQGAPTDTYIYYDPRPHTFPVGLLPRTSYTFGSLGCHQQHAQRGACCG